MLNSIHTIPHPSEQEDADAQRLLRIQRQIADLAAERDRLRRMLAGDPSRLLDRIGRLLQATERVEALAKAHEALTRSD